MTFLAIAKQDLSETLALPRPWYHWRNKGRVEPKESSRTSETELVSPYSQARSCKKTGLGENGVLRRCPLGYNILWFLAAMSLILWAALLVAYADIDLSGMRFVGSNACLGLYANDLTDAAVVREVSTGHVWYTHPSD